mgnify:CR=1 FL=1
MPSQTLYTISKKKNRMALTNKAKKHKKKKKQRKNRKRKNTNIQTALTNC